MLEAAARPLQFPDRTLTKQPRKRPTETSRRMRRLLYTAFTLVNLNYETFCPPFVLPSETRRKRLLLLNNFPSFLCYLYSFAPGKKLESENIFFVAALFFPAASSIFTNEPNSASQMARHDLLHFSPQIASKKLLEIHCEVSERRL